MSNTKNSRGASQPNDGIEPNSILSTDVYLYQVRERFRSSERDLVGKILTFIDAISESEQVAKARKDVIRDILYKGVDDIIQQATYEMEWLNRFLYDKEDLEKSHFGNKYNYELSSTAEDLYEKSIKPN